MTDSSQSIYIGLDLHGTLLNKNEKIEEKFHQPLMEVLKKLKTKAKMYICSGNDLPFVKQVIPADVFAIFDGFVLETGCVFSDGEKENVKTPESVQEKAQELRRELEKQKFPEVNEFRRRLTTVSLFCNKPKEFFYKIEDFLQKSIYRNDFEVTYSNVAVDVIPKSWDKFVGMKMIAGKGTIISVADSMNDFGLLNKSHFSFVPANAPKEVLDKLKVEGKKIVSINQTKLEPNTVVVANKSETEGVLEILDFVSKNL